MTVIVMHPDLYDIMRSQEDASEQRAIPPDDLILLTRYSPLGTVQVMDLDAEGMLDWLQQMEESIAALQKD